MLSYSLVNARSRLSSDEIFITIMLNKTVGGLFGKQVGISL